MKTVVETTVVFSVAGSLTEEHREYLEHTIKIYLMGLLGQRTDISDFEYREDTIEG